jgi:succinoglycan biosynthesis transport protein ExoP
MCPHRLTVSLSCEASFGFNFLRWCFGWGQRPRRVVAAALALLDQAGIRVAGTILTRVDGARHARAGFADSELYHPRYGGYFRP